MKKSQKGLEIIGNEEDSAFKQATVSKREGFFKSVEFDKPLNFGEFNNFMPNEYFERELNMFKVDILIEYENCLLNVENQSTMLRVKDLRRYRKYSAVISDIVGKEVYTLIICTADPPKKEVKLEDFGTYSFHPHIIYTKKIDGDEILNNIKYKVQHKQKLTDEECIKLAMLPVFKIKDDEFLEKISEALALTDKLVNSEEDKNLIQTLQLRFIEKFGTEEQKREILKMARELLSDNFFVKVFAEEAREEGIEKGIQEGKFDVALKLIHKKKMSIEEAAEITEIPLNQLKEAAGY